MQKTKTFSLKRAKKSDREFKVLMGLVDLYIETGKPVGSHTLKENGFDDLSSATIRNYFAKLEESGYLAQQHASGGRIPTDLAFETYALEFIEDCEELPSEFSSLSKLQQIETKEPVNYLNHACELLSQVTGLAAFISSPRFDHDFILDIKCVELDHTRILCIIITNFGLIQTETLYLEKKLSTIALKRLESYFQYRLKGSINASPIADKDEEKLANHLYHEVMIRYIVGHANFTHQDIFRTGFSKLLAYPEFNDPIALAGGLSLFEDRENLAKLLQDSMKKNALSFLIGKDLTAYSEGSDATVLTIPYYVNNVLVGSVALLGPKRIPYKKLFAALRTFSTYISESLTKSLYKFKLQYRQPQIRSTYLEAKDSVLLGPILLEDQTQN